MNYALKNISVIFPAYNEALNLPVLLDYLQKLIKKIGDEKQVEVIIVNDGSKDNTYNILEKSKKRFSWLKAIHHPVNRGYGAAVKSGILAASKDYIFFTDADLQFNLSFLFYFFKYIDKYDAVLGYRVPRNDPWPRKFFGYLWTKFVSLLFKIKIKDIDCAFKLFHSDIRKVVSQIKSEGATFSTELIVRMRDIGFRWIELPVPHFPRKYGKQTGANPKVIFKAFKELFMFWKIYRLGEK